MKKLTRLLTILLSVVGVNYASAQCAAGEVAVTIDITTDSWGYETYWEMVPSGNGCGIGTLFSGGNPAEVGCGGEAAQLIPFGGTGAGYASSTTINEGPFCVVDGTLIDLIIVDEYGDGGNVYEVFVDGVSVGSGQDDFSFTAASSFDDLSVANPFGEYFVIPSAHANTIDMVADVTNGGTSDLTDAILTVNVYESGTLINSYPSAPTGIVSGATTSLNVGTYPIPTPGEFYYFEYVVASAAVGADANTSNDTTVYFVFNDDSVYARDNGQALSGPASIGAGAAANGKVGMLYTLDQPDVLTSCEFALYPTDWGTVPQDIAVEVYDVVNGVPTTLLGTSTTMSMVGDSSATGVLSMIQVQFPGGLSLTDDSIAVMVTEPDTSLSIAMMVDNFTPSTVYIYWDANGWANAEAFGAYFSHPYYLRPAFGPTSGPVCTIGVSVTGNNVTTNGGSNGDATATATGGQGNITYAWTGGGSTASITNLTAGVYTVTVMDDVTAGCQVVESITITEPAPPTCTVSVTLSGNNVTTIGGSNGDASATVTGGQSTISYVWSTGGTASAITNLVAGVYSVTVSDNILVGCTATSTITITEPTVTVTCDVLVNVSVTAATTAGGSDGAAEALVSGAQGNLTYTWSNGATTSMITGLPTNTYSVTVTDDILAGCTVSASGLVTDPNVTVSCNLTVTATSTDPTAFGASDGSATAVPAGSQGNLAYVWDNTATTQVINGLTGGVFTVTVTDDITAGCTATASVTLTEPGLTCNIGASMSQNNVTTNGGSDGDAAVVATGGQGNITYMWTSGETTTSISGLVAGVYAVTVMDDVVAGCQAVGTVTITEPGGVTCTLGGSITSTNVSTNGGSDGEATVVATGAQGNVSYLWSNAATTAAISGLTAGTYVVTITDDIVAGCEVIVSTTITEPAVNGIGELDQGNTVSIYPNPSNGNFVVSISKEGEYAIVVRNVIGQTVENVILNGKTKEVRLNNVDAGIYFVTIQGDGYKKTEKIIVR